MVTKKPKGLGLGLEALLGPKVSEAPPGAGPTALRLTQLRTGRYQPRTRMDEGSLYELAESIKSQGVMQPVLVRPVNGGRYEIIAGERRWRAAQIAELAELPAVVREVDDHATLAMALIENIQREDLNPLEEATALKRLIDEFRITHQQAAEAVGRSRAAVSNLLRLLELPPEIKQLLEQRRLEMGHARALLTLPAAQALHLARESAEAGWSVRELEEKARAAHEATPSRRPAPRNGHAVATDPNVAQLEQELGEKLGARVRIQSGRGGRGKLVIEYYSLDELDGIIERIR